MKDNLSSLQIQVLDCSNQQQIEQYEEMFYKCFIDIENQLIFRKIWIFDDKNKKIRAKIPYSDQLIYIFIRNKSMVGAVAINLSNNLFQFKEFGFEVIDNNMNYCEVLSFFSIKPVANKSVWMKICEDLNKRKISDIFATTAIRILPLYLRLGFLVLESKVIQYEDRYFLHFDIDYTFKLLQK